MGEDENGTDGVDVLLNFGGNMLLVELVLFNTTTVGQSRGVEDANLGERLRILAIFKNAATYSYAIGAGNFVQTQIIGGTVVTKTALLVGAVEDVVVWGTNVVANEDIGEEFQECRLSDTSLPNKEDGIGRLNLVLRCPDDPLLEKPYVARNYGQTWCIKVAVVTYLIVGVLSPSSCEPVEP